MPREITLHREGSRLHDQIDIVAGADTAGGAPHRYTLITPNDAQQVVFHHAVDGVIPAVPNGVTLEAWTAIQIDCLERFQAGPYPCAENAEALDHYRAALAALRRRTLARMSQGVEGKLAAHQSDGAATHPSEPASPEVKEAAVEERVTATIRVGRVTLNPDTVEIGEVVFGRKALANTWMAWDGVGNALAALSPPFTDQELDVLGQVPVSPHARSGYQETRQAAAQRRS